MSDLKWESPGQKQQRECDAHNAAIDTAAQIRRLQNQLNDYHAQYEALEKDHSLQRTKDAKQAFRQSIISGIIGGVVGSVLGGLAVYYWPMVEQLVLSIIH